MVFNISLFIRVTGMAFRRMKQKKGSSQGLLLRTVKEIDKIRKEHYGLTYDCKHAAASVSRVFGRFVSYVQFDTPKKPAYLVLLGMPEENLKDTHNGVTGMATKYLGKPFARVMPQLLKDIGNCDGAVVVDNAGKVVRVGAQLINLDTRGLLKERKREYGKQENPARLLGFSEEVGTRHTSAIVASYKHQGIKVVTLSEETGDIRIYENGRILASTNTKDRVHGKRRLTIKPPEPSSPLEKIAELATISI
ncbi:MAG: hypothetical protein QT08_C0014G0029 [archaeon GW2011_AR17]|nr:MAG: hypothetical protein QT08_C0014G0029 [archaeon GW2011_AR17]